MRQSESGWKPGGAERIVLIALVVGMVIAGALVTFSALQMAQGNRDSEVIEEITLRAPLEPMPVPSFEGVDQLGREVDESILEGKWSVLTFGFTNCPTACPIMHGELVRLMGMLEGLPVGYVTISVDPAHDTPEQMRRYVDRLEVDHDRWRFVTIGDQSKVKEMVGELGFFVEDIPGSEFQLPTGGVMLNIEHPTRFLLVDPEGRVVLMPSGTSSPEVDALARQIRDRLGSGGVN